MLKELQETVGPITERLSDSSAARGRSLFHFLRLPMCTHAAETRPSGDLNSASLILIDNQKPPCGSWCSRYLGNRGRTG